MIRPTAVLIAALAAPTLVHAQDSRADVSLQASVRDLRDLEQTEAGAGVRLSVRLAPWLALDGQASYFPSDMGDPAFSRARLEGLGGFRFGPHLGRTGAYVALRGGAVHFADAPEPFACILIYPPPLQCSLAAGDTVPSAEASLGFEVFPSDRLVMRVEAGDQVLRFPGPAFIRDREVFDGHRWSHGLKASVSLGIAF